MEESKSKRKERRWEKMRKKERITGKKEWKENEGRGLKEKKEKRERVGNGRGGDIEEARKEEERKG